jgi:Tol biopolymer transport system component
MSPSGGRTRMVAGGSLRASRPLPEFGYAPSWSPDGEWLVFGAERESGPQLFMASADGGRLKPIPGTRGAFAPVLSPDGKTIAFARARIRTSFRFPRSGPPVISSYDSITTWTIEIDGSGQRRLTPWRNGLEVRPSSFSPDGSLLAASRFKEGDEHFEDALLVRTDGSGWSLLASNATRPAFSPDGSHIALFAYLPRVKHRLGRYGFYRGGLTVMKADGTDSRFLARAPFAEQSPPSWDPSAERLAYTEHTSVLEINVDGTCRRKVLTGTNERLYFGPVWQPGPGREAGRIAC